MRHLFHYLLTIVAALALSSTAALAHEDGPENDENPGCADGDAVCVDTNGSDSAPDETDQATSQLPIQGVVAAGGDPESQSGYAFADGDSSNSDALAGYIGVNSEDNHETAPFTGNTEGHFHRGGGNSPVQPMDLLP